MRKISTKTITQAVAGLCIKANTQLRPDVLLALKQAYRIENRPLAKDGLGAIIKNASVARKENLAICQDTGLVCVFVELGDNVRVLGDLKRAINQGVVTGYSKGCLRRSVVTNPLCRKTPKYAPAVIHLDLVKGENIKLTVLPKGFGCENKSKLKMLLPTASLDKVKEFVVESVKDAGADACPPYIVGVGIGGGAESACYLAKKALLKKVTGGTSKLERDLCKEINSLNIGAMGLGGKATCLGVSIQTQATHIAGLPVAVSISCHALRSASRKL